jgi:hypothetical protein
MGFAKAVSSEISPEAYTAIYRNGNYIGGFDIEVTSVSPVL